MDCRRFFSGQFFVDGREHGLTPLRVRLLDVGYYNPYNRGVKVIFAF
jgi:hypothetical protein